MPGIAATPPSQSAGLCGMSPDIEEGRSRIRRGAQCGFAHRAMPRREQSDFFASVSPLRNTARMPTLGKRWRHVIINTRGSWLHGDPRGFRNRGHRIHSSGDYKNPPPPGEHAGLFKYHKIMSSGEVLIPRDLRAVIGKTFVRELQEQGHQTICAAVTKVHAHALVELPDDVRTIKRIIGEAKRKSSKAVKDVLKGRIWSAGLKYEPVDSRGHSVSTYRYILFKQGADAWTWSFRDRSMEGKFGRRG